MLLPQEYPTGDLSHTAYPVFLTQPEPLYYATKTKPAVIKCKVAHALKAYFVCNEEVISEGSKLSKANFKRKGQGFNLSLNTLVDPERSITYTEAVLKVPREEVKLVLDNFSCKCHAMSSKGEVESKEAIVKAACK